MPRSDEVLRPLPCPVCGTSNVGVFERQEGLFVVTCENYDSFFMVETHGASIEEALSRWNDRRQPYNTIDSVPSCGQENDWQKAETCQALGHEIKHLRAQLASTVDIECKREKCPLGGQVLTILTDRVSAQTDGNKT